MTHRFSAALVAVAALVCFSSAAASAQQNDPVAKDANQGPSGQALAPGVGKAKLSALPPPPKGQTTVMGGIIRDFDPVRDQFKLDVFGGGHSVKVLFDARTQVFRDGKKVPLRQLAANDHASVETVLDGDNIYALRVHMLSHAPEGDVQGQVLDFDTGRSVLTVSTALSSKPIKLHVPPNTRVYRKGQTKFAAAQTGLADLVSGDLISAKFSSGDNGQGVAKEIAILATPGSAFTFTGNITVLDMHSGDLVLTDPTDNNTYHMHFNPLLFTTDNLHEGETVRVTARFDGNRYVARTIHPI